LGPFVPGIEEVAPSCATMRSVYEPLLELSKLLAFAVIRPEDESSKNEWQSWPQFG